MTQPETIESRIEYLLPGSATNKSMPSWPPDVFCLSAAILQSSGAYSTIVNDQAFSGEPRKTSKQRARHLKNVGRAWAESISSKKKVPNDVRSLWRLALKSRAIPLNQLGMSEMLPCRNALLDLLATADEACSNIGIYKFDPKARHKGGLEDFQFQAEGILVDSMSSPDGATLCKEIHPSRARVLPKMHTPQNGLTIRSLSHHLSYCSGSDMRPKWIGLAPEEASHSINLLIVPWPKAVEPAQFAATKKQGISDEVGEGGYGLFTFRPSAGPSVQEVKELISETERQVGHVDGVVFPELAMTISEFEGISKAVATPKRFLVSGVGKSATDLAGANAAYMDVVDPDIKDAEGDFVRYRIEQEKHHRWKLDKSQIVQYGLGSTLHPMANWWEHIELGHRQISFVTLRPWLTMSVLICEDLARPDPVGEVLRAVGPNLVIALLSDGPQISSRWPGGMRAVLQTTRDHPCLP